MAASQRTTVTTILKTTFSASVTFRPGERKHLNTGIRLERPPTPAVFCVGGASRTPLAVTFKTLHSGGGGGDDSDQDAGADLVLDVRNVTGNQVLLRDHPLTVYLVSIPLSAHVYVSFLHLFAPASRAGAENIGYARPARRHDRPKTLVKRAGGNLWTVKLSVTGVRWTRKKPRPANERLGATAAYEASIVVDTRPAPLNALNSVDMQMCSDSRTTLWKAQTLDALPNDTGLTRIDLRRGIGDGPPPKDLALQLCLYAANPDAIVLRSNPVPYMTRRADGGLSLFSPRAVSMRTGQTETIYFHNAYDSLGNYTGIFFPADIAGVDASLTVWSEKKMFGLRLTAYADCTIAYRQYVGDMQFIPEEAFSVKASKEDPRWSLPAILNAVPVDDDPLWDCDDDDEEYDDTEDSDDESTLGPVPSPDNRDSDSDGSRTPEILRMVRGLNTDDSDDDDADSAAAAATVTVNNNGGSSGTATPAPVDYVVGFHPCGIRFSSGCLASFSVTLPVSPGRKQRERGPENIEPWDTVLEVAELSGTWTSVPSPAPVATQPRAAQAKKPRAKLRA